MLQDLVAGLAGAAAVDVRGARLLLEGGGVLADIGPPDVIEGAGAEAVDALAVVGADDNVGEGGAILEDEDSVAITTFGLIVAGRCCSIVSVKQGIVVWRATYGCGPIASFHHRKTSARRTTVSFILRLNWRSLTWPAASVWAAARLVVPLDLGKLVCKFVFVDAEAARPAKVAMRKAWVCIALVSREDLVMWIEELGVDVALRCF